jgi:hypothetical protein
MPNANDNPKLLFFQFDGKIYKVDLSNPTGGPPVEVTDDPSSALPGRLFNWGAAFGYTPAKVAGGIGYWCYIANLDSLKADE